MAASIGETFKQEIAALQIQLQKNTAELQAKIAQLQESNAALLQAEHGDWGEGVFLDDEEYYDDALGSSGDPGQIKMAFPSFNSANPHPNYNLNMMPCSNMPMPGMSTHGGHGGLLPHPMSGSPMSQVGSANLATSQMMQPPMSGLMQMPGQMIQQNLTGQMSQPYTGHMQQGMVGQVLQTMPGQMQQTVTGHTPQSASGYMPPNPMSTQMNQSFPGQMLFSSNNNQMTSSGPSPTTQSGGQGHFIRFAPGASGREHFRLQRGGTSRGRPKTRGSAQGFGQGWRRGDGDVQ